VQSKVRRLVSIRDQLNLFEEAANTSRASDRAPRAHSAASPSTIFIVHGHDGAARLAAQGFLRAATELEPVVLHEQPNKGMTVIEKFEMAGAAAGYAVVLLTADDVGKAKDAEELSPRGRQNVVFEFGYFVGALGRART